MAEAGDVFVGTLRGHDDEDRRPSSQDAAGAAGLPFIKQPLVFETTGAMGTETQKWWKEMVLC